ncbi:MAG: acetate kinase [Bacteroidales bacterium]|jgi:acetate kinase|nr:acetate kinase [Bacteroidales bacterium]MCI2122318.1 acetate kinase [Bacteroidales bacterium]MCI2145356.1 acetate kinase [Bacteroidales bacterium]
MIILVLNCGSSSLKYQLLDMKNDDDYALMAKGLVERIGIDGGAITHSPAGKEKFVLKKEVKDHTEAVRCVLDLLVSREHGVLSSLSEIKAVGHRMVHGGETFSNSVLIDDAVVEKVKECSEFAPLHNPANLLGVAAVTKLMPGTPQVAVFDTAFHQTIQARAFLYGLPYKYYSEDKIRKYGFHGSSHRFVSRRACEMTGLSINDSRIVTCHLGNGSSICAVKNGKSVDTSMGFTPLDGLIMGTRCGSLDAGVVTYIMNKDHLSPDGMNAMMNKESGFLGVSGVSSDGRDLDAAAKAGNKRAQIAQDMLVYQVTKYIGAYAAAMGGLDAVVFTGGIGENNFVLRHEVLHNLAFLGCEVNDDVNDGLRGKDTILTYPSSKVYGLLVTTNEELVIARDTMHLTENE